MKLLIAGTPKTGNVWLERLLSAIYELPIVDLSGSSRTDPPAIDQQHYVTHQHFLPTTGLLEWGEREGVHFLTMIRHPADVFVSLYHYVNSFAPLFREKGWIGSSPAHVMIDEGIDSPVVLEFLKNRFRKAILRKSIEWVKSGRSIVVRYEDLQTDPIVSLKAVTNQIKPVELERIEQAVSQCSIGRMRKSNELMKLHCRRGISGQWHDSLSEVHYAVFRQNIKTEMDLLGYRFDNEETVEECTDELVSSISSARRLLIDSAVMTARQAETNVSKALTQLEHKLSRAEARAVALAGYYDSVSEYAKNLEQTVTDQQQQLQIERGHSEQARTHATKLENELAKALRLARMLNPSRED